jgi:hypothetical protein
MLLIDTDLGDSWIIFDKVKNFAFGYATKSGVTFGLFDVEHSSREESYY